jgi:hypothetical protein
MPYCRKCGLSLSEAATFCPTCGEPVDAPRRDPGQPTTPAVSQSATPHSDCRTAMQPPSQPLVQAPQAAGVAGAATSKKPPALARVVAAVVMLLLLWGLGTVILHAMGCNANGTIATPGDWTTATTLHSSDALGAYGALTSQPFTTTNEVRVVLSIPRGQATDEVLGTIVPASEANNVAYMNGESVSVSKTFDTDMVSGLNGTYVLQVAEPGLQQWSMEIQTSP